MTKDKKFQKMVKVLNLLDKEKNETLGAAKQLYNELKKKFKCKDLKQVKKKKQQLGKKKVKLGKQVDKAMAKFEKQFGKLVRAIEDSNPDIHRIAAKCIKGKEKGKKRSKKIEKGNRRSG